MWRQRGEQAAFVVAGLMREGQGVPLDHGLAVAAAALGLEAHLAMADSIILATARVFGAELWTQDADFEGMPGVKYQKKR